MALLQDYRGKTPVFLALFIGLWCPFCRRSIAKMSTTEPALKQQGVDTLCVVATPPENARLYFKYRPTRLRLEPPSRPTSSAARPYPCTIAAPRCSTEAA